MKAIKQIIPIIIFVPVGFLSALFLFRVLTSREPLDLSASAIALQAAPAVQGNLHTEVKAPPPAILPPVVVPVKVPEAVQGLVVSPPAASIKKQVSIKEEAEESEEMAFPPLRLNGIFSSSAGNVALINDIIVKEGDTILGATITYIKTDHVEVQLKGQTKTLRVK